MSLPILHRQFVLPPEIKTGAADAVVRVFGDQGTTFGFERHNPEVYTHLCEVAGGMGALLRSAGVSEATCRLGEEMGAIHDWGKDGLGANDTMVWDQERIIRFREVHSVAGGDKVVHEWDRFSDPLGMYLAARFHHYPLRHDYHTLPPAQADRHGLQHLLQATDRWSAFARSYAHTTGRGMTLKEGIQEWVVNGRPHPLGAVAIIEGREIPLKEALLPLIQET
jgi:hypothetical protein